MICYAIVKKIENNPDRSSIQKHTYTGHLEIYETYEEAKRRIISLDDDSMEILETVITRSKI